MGCPWPRSCARSAPTATTATSAPATSSAWTACPPWTDALVFEPTLPNLLTVFRILLVPVLVAVLLQKVPGGDAVAAGVFVLASATDAVDGWLARRRETVSTFGKLMDPLADKLLVTSA